MKNQENFLIHEEIILTQEGKIPNILFLLLEHASRFPDKIGNNLTIAMSNPLNALAIEDIELVTGLCVQIFVSTGPQN